MPNKPTDTDQRWAPPIQLMIVKGGTAVTRMEVEPSSTELRQSLEKILGLALGIAKRLGNALDKLVGPGESGLGPEPREGTPDEGEVKHLQD